MTRAYRVAANYLSTMRKGRLEQQGYTFVLFADELDEGLGSVESESKAEHDLLPAEIRIGCTPGTLVWLDRPHRLAYVLGEIFELDGAEAATNKFRQFGARTSGGVGARLFARSDRRFADRLTIRAVARPIRYDLRNQGSEY
jgi:hypothetical protein